MSPKDRRPWLVLLLLLAAAFALRAWGVAFGLPYVYHPDEGFEVYRALRLGMGGFDLERTGKGGLYFLLFLEYGVYFAVQRLTGAMSSTADFAREFVTDPSAFWLMGRWTNVVLGTATVALVAFQARRMASWRAGLLAAAFLAAARRHVVDSHYVTVDVPMTLFTFLAIVLVVEDLEGRTRLRTLGFALVAAYAMLNKLPAAVLFVPYFVAAFLRGGWRGPGGLLRPRTWWPPVLAALLFALLNPGIWLAWETTTTMIRNVLFGSGSGEASDAVRGAGANHFRFYARVLLQSLGPAGLVLAAAGLLAGARRRCRGTLLHASFLIPFFVLIGGSGSSHLYYERYATPLLPGLALLAALGLDDFAARRVASAGRANVLALVVAVLVVLPPATASVRFDRMMSRTDVRTLALEWVEAHVPAGSRVLIEGNPEELSQLTVPLSPTQAFVDRMIADLDTRDPGKAAFWRLKGPVLSPPRYELVAVDHLSDWGRLADYEAQGVEWVVLPPERFYGPDDPKYGATITATRRAFLDAMRTSGEWRRVAEFPTPPGTPGIPVEIWHREAD